MKIFIVLCESPLKILKIAVYHFLISFLVPELLRDGPLFFYRGGVTFFVKKIVHKP